jgi:hypothetical protein
VSHLENCTMWRRELDTKRIETEGFGELRNVMLKERKGDKMARENN